MRSIYTYILVIIIIATSASSVQAQSLLNRTVTIQATKKPLKTVLQSISRQGQFYFSYNSNIINGDSLVTLSATNKTVKQLLDMLFDETISYKEKDKYIILQRPEPYWYVSGYVFDERTNEGIGYASVYEKQQLVASMTNDQGYFQLKVKDKSQPAVINISKAWYTDTAFTIRPGQNQALMLKIKPRDIALDSVVVTPQVERNWLGKFFLSSKQRMQSLNLDKYFVDKPYQASVIPGWSTHGKIASQVVNKFSFNLLGGYSAGVNGFEIAGMFNIIKKDVRYAQVAGVFNIIGGNLDGLQVAGLYNQTLGGVDGIQIAGLSNIVKESISGTQLSGLYGHTSASMDGAQISGLASFARDSMNGIQIAGLANIAVRKASGTQISGLVNISNNMKGVQVSGLVNFAKRLDGVQVGFINIADTSSGYSIGFLNLVRKGYHKLSISTNEVLHLNAAFRTGNKKMYSILMGGLSLDSYHKAFSFGYGIGTEATLSKHFSLNPEISSEHLYLGDWEHLNLLNKFTLNLTYKVSPMFSVYAGPSFNVYYSNGRDIINDGYQSVIPPSNYHSFEVFNNDVTGWIGWQVGVNVF